MNFCPECGSQLELDCRFCPNCGSDLSDIISSKETVNNPPPPPKIHSSVQSVQKSPSYPQSQYYKPSDTEGIIALIFGILGFYPLPIIGNIVAITLGAISQSKGQVSSTGKAGLILGILGILCWIIFFGVMFSMLFSMFSYYPY
ncbi:MAG: zinc-ribbon domain-containing protein [Promethearchaeota archaeon]